MIFHLYSLFVRSPLVAERKWELEMKRFDEEFTQLDGKTLRLCIEETDSDGEWPDKHKRTIIPYSLFDEALLHGNNRGRRRQLGLLDLDSPPHFDLVIVDEAHHIRNTTTFTHQVVRYFCENAEAILFLTATPIQLGNQDLFTLLNLLRPDLVIDPETYNHMTEPNPFINRALNEARIGDSADNHTILNSLNSAGNTAWGMLCYETILFLMKFVINCPKIHYHEKIECCSFDRLKVFIVFQD